MLGTLDLSRARSVLGATAIVGCLAGLVAAVFMTVAGEPMVDAAIAIEEAAAAEAGAADHGEPEAGAADHGAPVVARGLQRGAGLYGAYALTGGSFGLLFGVAFLALGRGPQPAFRRAILAGAALAGALTVSPWLKYPPNPPAVGDPDTLGERQAAYVGLILLSAVVVFAAARLSGVARQRGWPEHRRVAAAVAAVAVPMLVAYAVLPPAPDEVAVPATLVWRFRVASLGGNLLLWAVLAVGFGWMAAERERRSNSSGRLSTS